MSIQVITQQALQTGVLAESEEQFIQHSLAQQAYSIEDSHALSDLYRALIRGSVRVDEG